ncbi:hypothetical protein ACIHFD_64390 [Nonomuraea sp. NPDC051941]|uniref:hypothetical protein n=1 Tax=Nonomuraea sp. NPDC051941 TaxID=3364373 RepID=UPI0037C5D3D3
MADAAEALGVRIAEHTRILRMERQADRTILHTEQGTISAQQVIVATNATPRCYGGHRRRSSRCTTTSWPRSRSTPEQLRSIGWEQPFGISDSGNLFHYYRRTEAVSLWWKGVGLSPGGRSVD